MFVVPAAHQQHHMLPPGGGFGPFSPAAVGVPPPAHQSPRHLPFTSQPLPAHLHHVLHSPGLAIPPNYTQVPQGLATGATATGATSFVNSPTGGLFTYPLSPTKTRQYQYLYQTFASE